MTYMPPARAAGRRSTASWCLCLRDTAQFPTRYSAWPPGVLGLEHGFGRGSLRVGAQTPTLYSRGGPACQAHARFLVPGAAQSTKRRRAVSPAVLPWRLAYLLGPLRGCLSPAGFRCKTQHTVSGEGPCATLRRPRGLRVLGH